MFIFYITFQGVASTNRWFKKHLEILRFSIMKLKDKFKLSLWSYDAKKILLLNSNKLNGKLSADIANLKCWKSLVCLKITWTARFLFGGHE
jgi:hypothetical protein